MEIFYGDLLASNIKKEIKEEINNIDDIKPCLAVILVGNNPASVLYVKNKNKAAIEVGLDFKQINLKEDITKEELIKEINKLNNDKYVDGIIIQLPLPKHLNEKEILNMIDYKKDVDGLHPINRGKFSLGEDALIPCTALGILEILKNMNVSLEGKNVVIVGRSNLVGLPTARLLLNNNATVTVCHSKTKDLSNITNKADILIVAIGKAKFLKKEYIKEGAYVIDVGINKIDDKLYGDVDFEDVKDKCKIITPVPKGVGPMTVTMLLKNTLKAYNNNRGLK